MKRWLLGLAVVFCLAGCNNEGKNESIINVPEQGELEEPILLAEHLQAPWSIESHHNTAYISERAGTIIRHSENEIVRQKVVLEEEISTASEAGFLGFVLAPDFEQSQSAFAYYTYEVTEGRFNRIIELKLEDDVWHEVRVLLDEIPSGNVHHGGRLKIGPDGLLYATAGDAAVPDLAQDLNSLAGKILRLNLDGTVPADNPFPNSYVYSYGHRNPQGLAWSPDGKLYSAEHGPNANDEINLIEPGANYGWPLITGSEQRDEMKSPILTSGPDQTWAPSGIAFYDGKLYFAALRGQGVYAFDVAQRMLTQVVKDYGRIRDVYIKDDMLQFITNNTDGRGNPDERDDRQMLISIDD